MDKQEAINLIRQKCIVSNPDIEVKCPRGDGCMGCPHYRECRLADVLLAIMSVRNEKIGRGKRFPGYMTLLPELVTSWNLFKDRLEDQSEECLKFLANLLK